MHADAKRPGRRAALAALALPPLAAWGSARARAADAPMDAASLLVAGPEDGALDRWSRVLHPALACGLPPEVALSKELAGGADGVTAANRFAVAGDPDGTTAMLVSGAPALAALLGDPRARYDAGAWVSVLGCAAPGVVMARPGAIAAKREVRIHAASFASPDIAALAGIEMLGAASGNGTARAPDARAKAVAQGAADAVLVSGHRAAERAAALAAWGMAPAFSLGVSGAEGRAARDGDFPAVPTLPEAAPGADGAMREAWEAAAAAARLEFAVVLPRAAPAARMAVWRQAASEAIKSLEMQALALSLGLRAADGQAAPGFVAAGARSVAALRAWLKTRYGWQAG